MNVRKQKSRGAVAVEFAFVFPILFLMVYGVVVYAYVFVLHESVNYATQEAAIAAVSVLPKTPDYNNAVTRRARAAALATLSWLPADQRERVLGSSGEKVEVVFLSDVDGTDAIQITLRFRLKEPAPLFPVIQLPLVGDVPRLPDQITTQAVARI
ncbi:MAG: TadE family protein [Pseudomonadota bacterium]